MADKRVFDVEVKCGSLHFFISFVYGDPVRHLRPEVWERLTQIGVGRDEPWFVVGDFNELMSNDEKIGGPRRQESSFFPFRTMAQNC